MRSTAAGWRRVKKDLAAITHSGKKLPPLPAVAEELLLEEIVSEAPSGAGGTMRKAAEPSLAPPPATPAEVAVAEAALRSASSRDEVAQAALWLARRHVRAAALFVVNRDTVAGLRAEADGVARSVEGIVVPAEGESVLAAPLVDGRPVRWGASKHPLDVRVLRALGREEAQDRLLLPIAIRDRVVNLLYVDNGPEPIAVTAAAALHALTGAVSAAYERLLRARKPPSP
jgi:hypothetical protein